MAISTDTTKAGELKVMAMQGSSREESYAQNSAFQGHNFHAVAKPVLLTAIGDVVRNIALRDPRRRHVAVADLGCSYGRNTLECAEFIIQGLQQGWACEGGDGDDDDDGREIQYFFSDLPANDFNALFQSLMPYLYQTNSPISAAAARENGSGPRLPRVPKMYAAGVPGSFHGRLFPSASLDLITCSYALHWLSQVPPSIIDKSNLAWNAGHTWTHKASQHTQDAYAKQSEIDVKTFLRSRAHELASGGVLFLLLASVPERKSSSSHQKLATWDLIDSAWRETVDEGIITSEEMDTFNMPMYMFNQHELESVLLDVPQLKVLHIETKENMAKKEVKMTPDIWLGFLSSAIKPVIEAHLGEYKAGEIFRRLKTIVSKQDSIESLFVHNVLVATLQRV